MDITDQWKWPIKRKWALSRDSATNLLVRQGSGSRLLLIDNKPHTCVIGVLIETSGTTDNALLFLGIMVSICATQVIPATALLLLQANTDSGKQPMRAITMSSNNHGEYLVLQDQRSLYGMRGLEAYASSHPSDPSCLYKSPTTYPPHKNIFAIGTTDLELKFAAIFEDKLHDNIVSGIQAILPDCDWGINVLRLGFDLECLENPITIHVSVAHEALTEDAACKIVSVILEVIAAAGTDLSEMKS